MYITDYEKIIAESKEEFDNIFAEFVQEGWYPVAGTEEYVPFGMQYGEQRQHSILMQRGYRLVA